MKQLIRFFYLLGILNFFLFACEKEELPFSFIEITLKATPVSAYGAVDGAVEAMVSGGQPPYSYFWSNGSNELNISGLSAGEYTLKVIDSQSAVGTKTIMVEQPAAIPLNLTFSVVDASRFNGDDGAITLQVDGGTPPYSYLWSNDSEESQLDGLVAGTYTVTVTDAGEPPVITVDSIAVNQPEFVCGRDSIIDIDGNKYATVQLGTQCWMAENLRTTHLPLDPLTEIEGHFCLKTNCTNKLGAHYTWNAAMNGAESGQADEEVQGICPCEWHLPTKEEWTELNTFLSKEGNGGAGVNVPNKMRGEESSSGFDALMAGNWGYNVFPGENAVFWTATQQSEETAVYRIINNFPLLGQGNTDKRNGLSVRCILNKR